MILPTYWLYEGILRSVAADVNWSTLASPLLILAAANLLAFIATVSALKKSSERIA
ncbi:MAG: hypothetical protein QM368_07350 [Bacillota bacterium]|nr:hypothetical protein [Bacillota bacterium]HHU30858.1 hypothetical protein [Bacillota bacterium]